MTEQQLQEIEARCKSATPGPVAWQKFGKEYCLTGQYGMRPIILSSLGKHGLMLRDQKRDLLIPLSPDHPDAVFYAKARQDIPALIAALREAQAELNDAWHRIDELETAIVDHGHIPQPPP